MHALPASGSRAFKKFELGEKLSELLGVPVRVTNDATMHGLAAIRGRGVEMVITLGTGLGTALFIDGVLSAHYQTLPGQDEPFGACGEVALRRRRQRRATPRADAIARGAHRQLGGHPGRSPTLGVGRRPLNE